MEKLLANQWAFVAGSAEPDGIGRATAERLAGELGASIILHGRRSSKKKLEAACAELKSAHRVETAYITADFSLMAEVDAMFDEIAMISPELWAVVNSVGMAHGWNKDEEDVTAEEWNKTMQIIVYAARRCTEKSLLFMPNGGRIVNIGSIGADVPWPKAFPYRKAKLELHNLTHEMACELKQRGILLNCVKPGLVATRQTKRRSLLDRAYRGQFSVAIEWLKENFRSDVMLSADEIAIEVARLCTPQSQVWGKNITIDNGLTDFWNAHSKMLNAIITE